MKWIVAVCAVGLALLAFKWWVNRPEPPAPLDDMKTSLESWLLGFLQFGLPGSFVRLTHCASGTCMEFRKAVPDSEGAEVLLALKPRESQPPIERLVGQLETAGLIVHPCEQADVLALGDCSETTAERCETAARLILREWALPTGDLYVCVFEGPKDWDAIRTHYRIPWKV